MSVLPTLLKSRNRACLLDVIFVHSLRRYSGQRRFLARARGLHTNFDGFLLHILGLSMQISELLPDNAANAIPCRPI